MADYLADVHKYDATANAGVVEKIVKHLGIALRSRDSSLVACSDPTELARVRDSWCKKHLGETDDARCDRAIETVCEAMSADTSKDRVTFYYLVAKDLGKLSAV